MSEAPITLTVMRHTLKYLIKRTSSREQVMNVNEIVTVTLRILIIGMALNSLDFGLTVAVTLALLRTMTISRVSCLEFIEI